MMCPVDHLPDHAGSVSLYFSLNVLLHLSLNLTAHTLEGLVEIELSDAAVSDGCGDDEGKNEVFHGLEISV